MEQDKTTLEVVGARVQRHENVLTEHENRLRDLERHYSADDEWRRTTDKTLTAINAKLETLVSADGKTYHTAKLAILTTFLSTIVGYIVGVMLK